MAWTYEEVTPSPVENTFVKRGYLDGVFKIDIIEASEGYMLHDNMLDTYLKYDEDGNGIGEIVSGYYSGARSVSKNYDFTVNPREFYAVHK